MSRPVHVHTDRSLIPPNGNILWLLRPLLDPALTTAQPREGTDPADHEVKKALARYYNASPEMFRYSELDDCDVAIVPLDWTQIRGGHSWHAKPDRELMSRVLAFADSARAAGKPVVVFFCGERSHEPLPIRDAYVYRCSIYRSRRSSREFAISQPLLPDIKSEYAHREIGTRPRTGRPSVGFCGFARPVTMRDHLKTVAYKAYTMSKFGHADISQYKGLDLRFRCMEALSASPDVTTNFTLRSGSVYLGNRNRDEARARARDEFVDILVDNDYQLCARGSANYSHRIWETLCVGRIPLFIDSDCVLPFEDRIAWDECTVTCAERDLRRLPEILSDAHASFTDEIFVERQKRCREVWEQVATPSGVAGLLSEDLQSIAARS